MYACMNMLTDCSSAVICSMYRIVCQCVRLDGRNYLRWMLLRKARLSQLVLRYRAMMQLSSTGTLLFRVPVFLCSIPTA